MEARKALTIAGMLIAISVAAVFALPAPAGAIAAGIGISMGAALGLLAVLMRRWQRELGSDATGAQAPAAAARRDDDRPPQALAG